MLQRLIVWSRWLYEVPKILHRDISFNNLMPRKEDGNVYAVLNDLDLAVSVDVKNNLKLAKQSTGTGPFMAIDLLRRDPTVHMYRHDLESLFYVLIWITSRFHNGKEIADPPLHDWLESDNPFLVKSTFILNVPFQPTEGFESFRSWVSFIHQIFIDGLRARAQANLLKNDFADDTFGGSVTFDTFQTILNTDLP
jgi:hypothetical protein